MDSKNNAIINFFDQLDRSYFMDINKEWAKIDSAFSIGYGQTISQPSLVLAMTLILDLQPTSKVLEIGTGSGYQTTLLAAFSESVYTVERIETLYYRAIERLTNLGYKNIYFRLGDGSIGWNEHQYYDRIMVTAASSVIPPELIDQLAVDGKMVIPVGPEGVQELTIVYKNKDGKVSTALIEHVRFVRLMGKYE